VGTRDWFRMSKTVVGIWIRDGKEVLRHAHDTFAPTFNFIVGVKVWLWEKGYGIDWVLRTGLKFSADLQSADFPWGANLGLRPRLR
jgi:hypothetical protein